MHKDWSRGNLVIAFGYRVARTRRRLKGTCLPVVHRGHDPQERDHLIGSDEVYGDLVGQQAAETAPRQQVGSQGLSFANLLDTPCRQTLDGAKAGTPGPVDGKTPHQHTIARQIERDH
jgi:hypothetical protein